MSEGFFDKMRARAEASRQATSLPAPVNRLDMQRQLISEDGGKYGAYAEINRITSLPLVFPMTDEEVRAYSSTKVLASAAAEGFALRRVQAEALYAYELLGGFFAPIGVGFGKTLIMLLCAEIAFQRGISRSLLHVPPNVLDQLIKYDLKWTRARVSFQLPIHVLAGRDMMGRRSLAKSGRAGLYISTYSLLSTKDADDILMSINPGLILLDECHNLKNDSAARTKRMSRYIAEARPQVGCASGTITKKSVMEYHWLMRAALKGNSVLPDSVSLACEWASIIDAEAADSEGQANAGALQPLVDWARYHFRTEQITDSRAGFRRAFQLRSSHTAGIVSSGDADIGTSLVIATRPVQNPESRPNYDTLIKLVKQVDETWTTPNGDAIEYAVHTWKWLYELSAGFYNQLTWPTDETLAHRRSISREDAKSLLDRAFIHHTYQQEYAKELREFLKYEARPHLDSPMLVGNDMARNGSAHVGEVLYSLWKRYKGADFEGRPERDSIAVRVCDYKVNAAAEWCQSLDKGTGALVWFRHQEVGRWLYEEFKKRGLDCLLCSAGPAQNAMIRDEANKNRIMIATWESHGEGKNLQHFHENYFVEWPRSAQKAEQTMGRTHRSGQPADELVMYVNATNEFDQMNFAACLNDALFVHETTETRQKLIYASYDPIPKIFPPAVLRARGLEVNALSKKGQRFLEEKFDGNVPVVA